MKFGACAVLLSAILVAACGIPESATEADGTWVGTMTTEGNVTTVTVIERRIEPIPVSSDEVDWRRERTVVSARSRDPSWAWSGPDVPDYRPYFDGLHPDHSGWCCWESGRTRDLPAS